MTGLEQIAADVLGMSKDQVRELAERLSAMRCGEYGDVRLVYKDGELYKISSTIESKPYYRDNKKTDC